MVASREISARKVKPLQEAATAAVIKHLESKAPDYACLACRNEDFILYNHLTALPASDISTGNFTSQFYPTILTVCSNCGFVMQFVPTGDLLEKLTSLATEAADD